MKMKESFIIEEEGEDEVTDNEKVSCRVLL